MGRVSQLRVRRRGPYRRLARLEALHVRAAHLVVVALPLPPLTPNPNPNPNLNHVRAAHLVVVALPLPLQLVGVLRVRVTQLARHLGEGWRRG